MFADCGAACESADHRNPFCDDRSLGRVTEIVEGLDGPERGRIEALRRDGRFFWIDIRLSETSPDDLSDVLRIPAPTLHALLGIGESQPAARRFHADAHHVVFSFSCYLESAELA